jgi:hypothetical protein
LSLGKLWPAANCQALYHLENANDSSGHSHTLTNSDASFSSAKFGVGVLLSRSKSAYLGVYSNLSITKYSDNWTAMGWVCASPVTGAENQLFYFSDTGGGAIRVSYYYHGGAWNLYVVTGSAAVYYPVPLSSGTWHHIAIANVGSTHVLSIYFDGNLLGSQNINEVAFGETVFYFGWSSHYGVNGYEDEFAIYNKTLTAQEIRRYYAWATGRL